MVPSKELKGLLAQLGIGESNNPEQYRNFLQCQKGATLADLEAELAQLVTIKGRLEQEIRQAAREGKIVLHGEGQFKYSWNKAHNYLEITTANPQPPKIMGVVTCSKSNNDPAVTDFTGRIDAIFAEAQSMVHNKQQLMDRNKLFLKETMAIIEREFNIWHDLNKSYKDRENSLELITQALQIFLIFIAIDLIKDSKKDPAYVPKDKEIEEKMKQMWTKHVQQASGNIRPAIFWANRANDFKANQDESNWEINCLLPISNISSNERSLRQHKLNNHYYTRTIAATLGKYDKDYMIDSEKSIDSNRAAASVGAESDKMPTLVATITRIARDKLIPMLRNGQPIPAEGLSVDLAYNTLVSPTLPRSEILQSTAILLRFNKASSKKYFGEGNEKEIWTSAAAIIAESNKIPAFEFSAEDIKAIKDAVPAHKDLEMQLRNIKIKHTGTLANFPINFAGAFSHLFITSMHESNLQWLQGMAERIKTVVNKLNNQIEYALQIETGTGKAILQSIKRRFDEQILNNINVILQSSHGADFDQDKYQAMVLGVLEFFNRPDSRLSQDSRKSPIFKAGKELAEILEHFNYIKRVFSKPTPRIRTIRTFSDLQKFSADKRADYIAATCHAMLLEHLLGYNILDSCKSGKDRTGLIYSCLISLMFTGQLSPEYIANGLRFGPGSFLVALNIVGSEFLGLQIDADVLSAIDPSGRLEKLINQKMPRLAGQTAEGAFTGYKLIKECLAAKDRNAMLQKISKNIAPAGGYTSGYESETGGESGIAEEIPYISKAQIMPITEEPPTVTPAPAPAPAVAPLIIKRKSTVTITPDAPQPEEPPSGLGYVGTEAWKIDRKVKQQQDTGDSAKKPNPQSEKKQP